MLKKYCCIFLICMMAICLTGCKDAIPEMTEEETVLVTNYAATLLLKYDVGYQTKLLNQEQLEKEEELQRQIKEEAERLAKLEEEREAKKQEEEAAANSGDGYVEEVAIIDPSEFLSLDGISISLSNVEYLDQYPNDGEDLFFTTNATPGCKLAVIHLSLSNQTSETVLADILSTNARFKVSFNDGDYHSTMSTLFAEDFSVYKGEISANSYVDTVLLVELKEDECVDVNSINLFIKANGNTLKTKLVASEPSLKLSNLTDANMADEIIDGMNSDFDDNVIIDDNEPMDVLIIGE